MQVRYSEDSSDGGEFINAGTGDTPSAARIAADRVWSRLTELRIRFYSVAVAKRPQGFNETWDLALFCGTIPAIAMLVRAGAVRRLKRRVDRYGRLVTNGIAIKAGLGAKRVN